jgi:hypothetical protein
VQETFETNDVSTSGVQSRERSGWRNLLLIDGIDKRREEEKVHESRATVASTDEQLIHEAKRLGLDSNNEQKTTRKRRAKYCHLLAQLIN